MIAFFQWIKSIGLYYSFHRIEDIAIFAESRTNISWAFLNHSAINRLNLKAVNPKIIELKGAFLNIGLAFKAISKEILLIGERETSVYFDIATLPTEALVKLMRLRIFAQNIGFMLIENKSDFQQKIAILRKTILDYYFNTNPLEEIRATFFRAMVSRHCYLPIIATNLYEEKVVILISNERLEDSIEVIADNYRLQVPFSLKTSDLSYFYKW